MASKGVTGSYFEIVVLHTLPKSTAIIVQTQRNQESTERSGGTYHASSPFFSINMPAHPFLLLTHPPISYPVRTESDTRTVRPTAVRSQRNARTCQLCQSNSCPGRIHRIRCIN